MADRICDNCMTPVPVGSEKCPNCGIQFENTNPGGALPNGWVLAQRYTVGRYVDIDGEGVTYSAIDAQTLQWVTIKEFMPVTLCASRDETGAIQPKPGCEVLFKTTRMDFAELYSILLRLGLVEGLVQVLDVMEENNTAYAVLEKIEGPTLAEYLTKRDGAIEPARALALLRPVMTGVDALHTANLVHRGISPENIILESGGTARLTGYGTLALRQQGSELKAKLYPGYSAPEQYAASAFEGRYTDIYALGAVLYRLVTGITPYSADERKVQDTMRSARANSREVPPFLSSAISRAMRMAPAERLQTIAELRLALAGESPASKKGFWGLTRQQMIVGAAALGAVVILLLIILIISAFTRNRGPASSSQTSSSSSSSQSSSVSIGNTIPSLVGKLASSILDNPAYTDTFKFDEPEYAYSLDVAEGYIISQTPLADTVWDGVTPIRLVISQGREPVPLPDFVGTKTTQADAEAKLKDLGITYKVVTEPNDGTLTPGLVVRTDPTAGTVLVPPNLTNEVTLYVAAEVATIPMPNLVGLSQAAAETELQRLNITYRVELTTNDGTKRTGYVDRTEPAFGSDVVPGGATAIVYVYDNYYMPDLSEYVDKAPDALVEFLKARKIAYTYSPTTQPSPSVDKNGAVARLDYIIGGVVNNTTVVTITLYDNSAVAPDPGDG